MPRSGGGVYSLPAGSIVTDGVDDILAAQHNDPLNDIALDMNTARPIVAGGTGATTAPAALVSLGLTATAAEINVLDGVTATTAELNILDGVTATTAEINHIDGVTSPIQTQLNGKQAEVLTTNGDIVHRAGGVTTRLPIGTAGQYARVNAGATALEYASPQFISTSGGTLTDITTSFANRLSVAFTASAANVQATVGVGIQHQSATATDIIAELRLYDTVSLTDVLVVQGGETAVSNVGYAVRFALSLTNTSLVIGRGYELQLWLRKSVSAGPTLPRDLRIDGLCI